MVRDLITSGGRTAVIDDLVITGRNMPTQMLLSFTSAVAQGKASVFIESAGEETEIAGKKLSIFRRKFEFFSNAERTGGDRQNDYQLKVSPVYRQFQWKEF